MYKYLSELALGFVLISSSSYVFGFESCGTTKDLVKSISLCERTYPNWAKQYGTGQNLLMLRRKGREHIENWAERADSGASAKNSANYLWQMVFYTDEMAKASRYGDSFGGSSGWVFRDLKTPSNSSLLWINLPKEVEVAHQVSDVCRSIKMGSTGLRFRLPMYIEMSSAMDHGYGKLFGPSGHWIFTVMSATVVAKIGGIVAYYRQGNRNEFVGFSGPFSIGHAVEGFWRPVCVAEIPLN